MLLRMLSLVILAFASTAVCLGQTHSIDTQHSTITVHVFKSGLFSAFGDNHEIRAPISSGFFDREAGRVQVVVDARKLVVLDPNLSPEKRAEVQERMLGPDVLDTARFQEIRFEANAAKQEGADRFLVTGMLSLHGKTRPVSLQVVRAGDRYRGAASFKQRDFGITPVSVAGGTVKVKDELKIEFDVLPAASANPVQSRQ